MLSARGKKDPKQLSKILSSLKHTEVG